MFGSFDSAYLTVAAAKACELEPLIGSELFDFAQQHLAQLERKAGLSEARKADVRKSAIKDVSTIVAIGACDSVLVAFRIFDLQRKGIEAQQSAVLSDREVEQKTSPSGERISSEDVSLQANDVSVDQTRLPIASGAYVQKKSFCTDLRKGELEMIDFSLDDNRRSFSTGENSCVVSSIKSLSASRSKVAADCDEFGEVSQFTFFLDKLPNGDIRINGDDLFFCSVEKDAKAPKQSVQDLIGQWEELNENCRGGFGDDPNTMKACDQRTEVDKQLEALGYCYDGETTATSEWKKCK